MLAYGHRRVRLPRRSAYVSFTFDDFFESAAINGAAIMEQHNLRATFYASMGFLDKMTPHGRMFSLPSLHAIYERGHEIATHTLNHYSARTTTPQQFKEDALRGKEALLLDGAVRPTSNFAYPFGNCDRFSIQALKSVMRSCRTIDGGANVAAADLEILRAQPVYGTARSAGLFENLLDRIFESPAWLIFYTHDVQPEPSTVGCTPELLNRVVSSAVRSGARVLPVNAVLDEIGAPSVRDDQVLTAVRQS